MECRNYRSEKSMAEEIRDIIGSDAYQDAIVYEMSSLYTGLITEWTPDDDELDEVLEARFFGRNGECHIYRYNNALMVSTTTENGADDYVRDYVYPLMGRFSAAGTKLAVRKYYVFDDDGQGRVVKTRCVAFEGGV